MSRVVLPTDKKLLADTMFSMYEKGRSQRNPLSVEWTVNYWFLQGVRRFSIMSFKTGQVRMAFETSEGQLVLRYEDVLDKFQKELGRMMKTNINPRCRSKGTALEGSRKAAMGQVVLDDLVSGTQPETTKLSLFEGLLTYGTMGLATWVSSDVGVHADVRHETVPPWQFCPIPAQATRAEEVNGLMRNRKVPLEWLMDVRPTFDYGGKDLKAALKIQDLEVEWVAPGDKRDDDDAADGYGSHTSTAIAGAEAGLGDTKPQRAHGQQNDADIPYVELKECWTYDDNKRVARYIACVGRRVVQDVSYEDREIHDRPIMPIAICRYHHTGGFWGRSYVGPLVPINMETERMLQNLFKNVSELDNFGFLAIPATFGVKREQLKATTRPRVIFYEPDYAAPKEQIRQFQPTNTGDFPGKVVALGNQIMDRISKSTPMDQGQVPGRLDSASGLGLLYETSSIGSIPVGVSIEQAYTQNYQVLLQKARDLLDGRGLMHLSVIDDQITGVVVNPENGEIEIGDRNPIPHPMEVEITIMDRDARTTEVRKQEVLGMLQAGYLHPYDVAWINHKEQLGLPEGLDQQKVVDATKSCMFRNIVAWGDGQVPQRARMSSHDFHEVHIRVLEAFMNRDIYQLGSKEVRDVFEQRKAFHEAALGGFPEAMPNPEDMGATPWATQQGGPPPEQLQQAMAEANGPPQ